MDVVGWVTISNNSGSDFTDARVKLMAGNVAVVRSVQMNLGVIGGLAMAGAAPERLRKNPSMTFIFMT